MTWRMDSIWHRSGTVQTVSPVATVRGLGSSCSSATSGTTAPRDLKFAPALDAQTTS